MCWRSPSSRTRPIRCGRSIRRARSRTRSTSIRDFSFPYPYPIAISVNTWLGGGMEYPMISFNGHRPVKDDKTGGRPTRAHAKYGLIGVVIHEVGHNYFPMIVNSDERQWTWMDEGINSFLEYLAELRWDENFPVLSAQPQRARRHRSTT